MELMGCTGLAVPGEVMRHVVRIESSFNPYAIGVVGGRLARQPRSLPEALSTVRMLEREGYNFSLGLAQVNRHNLASYGLDSYERAFDVCPNLVAGSQILAECYGRSGRDWGKAFSCYYSGNFVTGFRHGYVQKVVASWQGAAGGGASDGRMAGGRLGDAVSTSIAADLASIVTRRIQGAAVPAELETQIALGPADAGAYLPAESGILASAAMPRAADQRMPPLVAAATPPGGQWRGVAAVGPSSSDDAPVVVQAMGAPSPRPARQDVPQNLAGAPAQTAPPGRDQAFVF